MTISNITIHIICTTAIKSVKDKISMCNNIGIYRFECDISFIQCRIIRK